MKRAWFVSMLAVALVNVAGESARAQDIGFRGFGDFGSTRFAATQSFDAVLGSHSLISFGGGVEVVLAHGIFVNVQASRVQKDGTRVFVQGTEVFDLGIPTTVRVTPIQVTGGYRFTISNRQIVPYVGGGIGWYRYSETSDFANDSENVSDTSTGYHFLGGVEFRVARLFAVSGEAEWSVVPDALGQDPTGVSTIFGETDLGGLTFRVKAVIGR